MGRPRSGRSGPNIDAAKATIAENPNQNICGLGRKLEVPKATMRRVIKSDLGLKSLAVLRCQQLNPCAA